VVVHWTAEGMVVHGLMETVIDWLHNRLWGVCTNMIFEPSSIEKPVDTVRAGKTRLSSCGGMKTIHLKYLDEATQYNTFKFNRRVRWGNDTHKQGREILGQVRNSLSPTVTRCITTRLY